MATEYIFGLTNTEYLVWRNADAHGGKLPMADAIRDFYETDMKRYFLQDLQLVHNASELCALQVPKAKPCSERWRERAGVSAGRDRSLDRQGKLDQRSSATVRARGMDTSRRCALHNNIAQKHVPQRTIKRAAREA